MSNPILTVDTRGAINDPRKKLERVLAYLYATQASQSNIHKDHVVSIADLVRQHGQNKIGLRHAVDHALNEVLPRYFDSASVDVRVVDSKQPGKFDLQIRAIVIQDGKEYDLANVLTVDHEVLEKVAEIEIR